MNIMTKTKFSKLVEDLVRISAGNISIIDAILEICTRHTVDPSDVNRLLSRPLIEKVTAEAQMNRLLKDPPMNTLPV